MGRALDSHREPVSPELVLVDPALRMRLALEVARIEVETRLRGGEGAPDRVRGTRGPDGTRDREVSDTWGV